MSSIFPDRILDDKYRWTHHIYAWAKGYEGVITKLADLKDECMSLTSSGNSPHPSMPEEEDSQSELLIAEDKMSPEQEGQLMPRYDPLFSMALRARGSALNLTYLSRPLEVT